MIVLRVLLIVIFIGIEGKSASEQKFNNSLHSNDWFYNKHESVKFVEVTVDKTIKSMNKNIENSIYITTADELSQSNEILRQAETTIETTETTIESTGTTIESTETTIESTGTTVESTETTIESTETTIESTETTIESTGTTIESTETTIESTETTIESTGTTIESTETTIESTGTTIESTETTIESTGTTIESTETTIESTGTTIESTESTIESTETTTSSDTTVVPTTPPLGWPSISIPGPTGSEGSCIIARIEIDITIQYVLTTEKIVTTNISLPYGVPNVQIKGLCSGVTDGIYTGPIIFFTWDWDSSRTRVQRELSLLTNVVTLKMEDHANKAVLNEIQSAILPDQRDAMLPDTAIENSYKGILYESAEGGSVSCNSVKTVNGDNGPMYIKNAEFQVGEGLKGFTNRDICEADKIDGINVVGIAVGVTVGVVVLIIVLAFLIHNYRSRTQNSYGSF